MPLQATSGAASYDGFGGGVAAVPNYIEDVFSNYLYTGNGSTQTITNGIDLVGKGGLVWAKCRSGAYSHMLQDTVRGSYKYIQSDNTVGQNNNSLFDWFKSFNSDGFTVAYTPSYGPVLNDPILNASGQTYASWTFRKQPKFFDVVTYTGTGANRTISHSLGSTPGCIIVKRTDTTSDWQVYHNGLTSAAYSIQLNLTNAQASAPTIWNSTAPTSTVFFVGTDASVNASGGTYVAYIYAHNAGGFGLTGTDNVITCGSFTTDGTNSTTVSLGYETQWVMVKKTNGVSDWFMFDTMRGMPVSDANDAYLRANLSNAETKAQYIYPTATGFFVPSFSNFNNAGDTYIYIAIRRGPMKVPTDATKVFVPITLTGDSVSGRAVTTNFPVDMYSAFARLQGGPYGTAFADRLRSGNLVLNSSSTAAEQAQDPIKFDSNTGVVFTSPYSYGTWNFGTPATTYVEYAFRRAPSFFDEVCYTGTGATQTLTHNLQATPELVIIKSRSGAFNWAVLYPPAGYTAGDVNVYLNLNTTGANNGPSTLNGGTAYTSTTFTVSSSNLAGASGQTYVAYLFATCAGVSKVTSFTGNGSTQTINCGFTSGARFVLIKATSTTGNWLTFDTARGMTTSTDPWLALNSTAAESATTGACTTTSVGFTVDESKLTGVNTNGVSYIALAIA